MQSAGCSYMENGVGGLAGSDLLVRACILPFDSLYGHGESGLPLSMCSVWNAG